ncbi:hypothetical protein [Kutzneria albida]|uniref:Secreted protein n=1 Tax=Kutzneria albida DSM 43870 TaxID=1449976 RepID=W5WGA6_9PSEU|nr:hypothetical protein [Kutzneria albida]AHI00224.1 hypothetical protein KALB_6865 [Kutzneria albida DSM 43870]
MRRTVIGIGLLALLTAGCGAQAPSPEATAPVGKAPAPVVSTTAVPPTSPGTSTSAPRTGPAVPPNQIDYSQVPETYPRSVWTTDNGRTVVVMGEEGGCAKLSGKVLAQNAEEVRVELLTTTETHRMCPLYVRNVPVSVTLDAPLGARKLVLTAKNGPY